GVKNNALVHGMSMRTGESWSQTYESNAPRKGDDNTDTVDGYKVGVVTLKAQPMLSIRATTTQPEIAATLGRLYGRIGMRMSETGASFAGAPFAIYHAFDEEVDLEAGIPIDKTV